MVGRAKNIGRGTRRLFAFPEPPLIITAMFLVFVVARYMQWGARREIFATLRIEFLLGMLLTISCAMLLPRLPMNIAKLKDTKRVMIAIGLLFFAMIIQVPFAADKELAQGYFIDRVIKFAMLTFFMGVLIRSPRMMRWFMAAFIFACFYVTQEAARGALGGGLIWENQGIMRLHGAVPIYRHPNSLAGVAIGLIPFTVFMFQAIESRILRLMLLAPLGTSLVCLMYSGSRTGYVGFIFFVVFWWWKSSSKLKWIAVAAAVTVAAYPIIPDQYIERFQSIGGQEAEGHSKAARIEILEDAVEVFMTHPGGVGVASFPAVRSEMFGRTQDTHNLYLEVATNLGVQGLLVFLFLLFSMFRALWWVQKSCRRELGYFTKIARSQSEQIVDVRAVISDIRFLAAAAVATEGFLVVRIALGIFGMDLYEVYWWFVSGMIISLALIVDRVRRNRESIVQRMDMSSVG